MGLSCNSSSVGMDFLHSFMSGLPQPGVLEWFISTSGEAMSACKPLLIKRQGMILVVPNLIPIIPAIEKDKFYM